MAKKKPELKKSSVKGLSYEFKVNGNKEIVYDKDGLPIQLWKFQYTDNEREKQKIRLGEMEFDDAEYIATMIAKLVECSKVAGSVIPFAVQTFIDKEIDYSLRKKLLDKYLIQETEEDRYNDSTTIGELTDQYMEYHKNAKENTWKGYNQTRNQLVKRFGRDKKLADITAKDVKHFENDFYASYKEATVSRHIGRFKEIMRFGIKNKLVDEQWFSETFENMRIGKMHNDERKQEVTMEMYQKIVSVCVNTELRFAFFLARLCAFRCPSECSTWRWSYLNFETKRVKVWDIKRQRIRIIPMFGYLYPFLAELFYFHQCKTFLNDIKNRNLELKWDSKEMISLIKEKGDSYVKEMSKKFPKGEDWIFTERFRKRKSRGKQIPQLLKKAKVSLEKAFINCRGTRESEWVQLYGLKAATEWTGNSVKVAQKHYLEISNDTWTAALLDGDTSVDESIDMSTIKSLIGKFGFDGLRKLINEIEEKDV